MDAETASKNITYKNKKIRKAKWRGSITHRNSRHPSVR